MLNDPVADGDRIRELVAMGYLVRTRTDADTVEARSGDTTRREAAFASGAQLVSTDYEVEDPRWPGFVTDLPGDGAGPVQPRERARRLRRRRLRGRLRRRLSTEGERLNRPGAAPARRAAA